ncbi:hypothetical protein DIURU_002603 [Diutina rugosa]|uniref:RNA helicase n=1 Tax=Diutina rugosa TaxID=5481 RepID=A0A642UPF1_DIURU|nr:uncharacterized protein DIURU_002603 [Diutina rugosa]KAA8903002.1 hypothetical protein DIURU_002603 [Diutina rugosa]
MAGDKRKRKRSKKKASSEPAPEPVPSFESDVSVKVNKKIKFDDDAAPIAPQPEVKSDDIDVKSTPNGTATSTDPIQPETDAIPVESEAINAPKPTKPKDAIKPPRKKSVAFYDHGDDDDDDFITKPVADPKQRARELQKVRHTLPIYRHRQAITSYIDANPVTVIIGETGSGKSTQIPQFLLEQHPQKLIACTQPRRVAAASLAQRVAEEHGCHVGEQVGYQVRFSNVTSHKTKLKYLTDGMLLREIMLDDKLQKYSTIIIDEAHERTVLTDLILGFLKSMLSSTRPDLKVVIMSATLNAELFSQFFDNAPILFVEGKMYPVARYYLSEPTEDVVDTMVRAVVQANQSELEGDILCFLPGQEEIDNCVSALNQLAPELPKEAPLIQAVPLYAALSPGQQAKIFAPVKPRQRKVIVATNIAETSITVPGVKYVIDSGLRKVKVWKHQLGISTLLTTPISQASARQRAGRAGRESAGKVFRLYSESMFEKLPQQQESEIMRNDVIYPILTLKRMGVDDLLNWTWLEHPGEDAIVAALNTLYSLGALNDKGQVTELGVKMAVLPLAPQLSVVLITAHERGVLDAVIDIISCLSVDNLVLNVTGEKRDDVNAKRRQFYTLGRRHGDLITFKEWLDYFRELGDANAQKEWCKELHFSFKGFKNVLKVKQQLRQYMRALTDLANDDHDDEFQAKSFDVAEVLKSFLKGYVTNTAIGMPDRSYRTFAAGQLISIHPSSVLFGSQNDAILYIDYVFTTKPYGRNVSRIELGWLQEVAPSLLGRGQSIE